jgi:hypothetical protein
LIRLPFDKGHLIVPLNSSIGQRIGLQGMAQHPIFISY